MDHRQNISDRPRSFRRRSDVDKNNAPVTTGNDELRTVIESAGLGVFEFYPLSGEMRWSARAREQFGLSADAPVNYNLFLVGLHPEDRTRITALLDGAFRREQEGGFSAEFRTAGIEDGKERLIALSGRAFFNQRGEAVQLLCTTQDISERGRAGPDTRQTEELFRTVFDSVYEGILLHAPDGSILDMNEQFLAMYRVGREQLRKLTIADISSTANPLGQLPKIWAKVMAGEKQLFEWKAKRPADGTTFDVEVFLNRFEMRGQAVILAAVRDISDRKRLEEALRLSEERYRLLFDKSPFPKWVIDLEAFRVLEVNDAAVNHYGYSRQEFGALSLAEIRTPGEFERFVQWVKTCAARGERFEGQVQTKHRKKSGEVFDADVRYTEIMYNGRRAGLGVIIDITERKRTEEALRESEGRYRALISASSQVLYRMSPDWSAMRQLQGGSFIADTEKPNPNWLQEYIHPDDQKRVLEAIGEAVRNGTVFELEHRVRRVDGTLGWTFSRAVPVRNAAGEIVEWFGAASDITDRKRAEQERERLIEELKRSNSELQQFAYVASHDLQEPLRTVASYVELLSLKYKGKIDATADRYIGYAVEGANRMSELINDLLAYSRVGTRGKPFERTDMRTVYERAVANLRRAVKESGARITTAALPAVIGDDTQLVLLMQNLIANAVKFHKPDVAPEIHISAERGGNAWVFGVHDNGIGIEPRFFDRIFVIFQRLHTREEYSGTGIGLAICRRIVERHGGRIWVESNPEEGSTFYFSMPDR